MRFFIASKINDEYIDVLLKFNSFVKNSKFEVYNKLKFVEKENIHLTYFFLGDIIDDEHKYNLMKSFEIFKNLNKIKFFSTRLGYFPDKEKIKVIWADVDKEASEMLNDIHLKTKDILNRNKIYTNENFVPHITLARVKSLLFKDEVSHISQFQFDKAFGFFENIALMNSVLSSRGPKYETVFEVKLL